MEEELRRRFGEVADRFEAKIAAGDHDHVEYAISVCSGPTYLQSQTVEADSFGIPESKVIVSDGYARYSANVEDTPTPFQISLIAEYRLDGPLRAADEVRRLLDALLQAGVSPGTLRAEVDLALARSVMEE